MLPNHDPEPTVGSVRALRMLFFLDYMDGATGVRFTNSPGLLPLIAHTRHRGFDVEFVSTEEELFRRVAEGEVDVVGISSMERLLPRSIPVARRLRELRPELPLMVGGNSIDVFATELAAGLFDVVVLKEAEHLLPALLDALAAALGRRRPERPSAAVDLPGGRRRVAEADPGGALSPAVVDALCDARFHRRTEDGGNAAIGLGRVLIRDSERATVWQLESPAAEPALGVDVDPTPREDELAELCRIPWDLVETEGWKNLELYAQRGCRWSMCRFCSVHDRAIRCVPAERVVDVIEEAVRHGVEVVSFADNLFVQFQDWNRAVLEGVIERHIPVTFRAQTMANRTVWPLLDLMREAGFVELAFGLETLLPERAERMAKSFHGPGYVRQALETVERTAQAGIFPVLYLIMVDPWSTLSSIAAELEATLTFLRGVYQRTGILPRPSYSLVMLPVAGTQMTAESPFTARAHVLGDRTLHLPENFCFPPEIVEYLNRIGQVTDDLPWKRENLAAFPLYFDAVIGVAREYGVLDLQRIEEHVSGAWRAHELLVGALDRDIATTARAFERELSGGLVDLRPAELDFRRFGPYVDGIRQYGELLEHAWQTRSAHVPQ